MKILVTGAAGQLGYDLLREAGRRGHQAIGTDLAWWIWAKRTGMDIITPPMKAAISAGMTSPVRYSARLVTAQR